MDPMNPAIEPAPWFRQAWPWLLISGPLAVVIAGGFTMVLAFGGADGLVSDDYYKQGLAINRVLARERAAQSLAIEGTLALRDGRVYVLLTSNAPLPDRLTLVFAHPTRAGEDRTVALARETPGEWSAPLPPLAAGRWRVQLSSRDWRVDALVDTRKPAPVRLAP